MAPAPGGGGGGGGSGGGAARPVTKTFSNLWKLTWEEQKCSKAQISILCTFRYFRFPI